MQIGNENSINRVKTSSPKPFRDPGLDLCSVDHKVVETSLHELSRRDQEVDVAAARLARGRELEVAARSYLESMDSKELGPEAWLANYEKFSAAKRVAEEMHALGFGFSRGVAAIFVEKNESLILGAAPARFQAALTSKDGLARAIDGLINTNYPSVRLIAGSLDDLNAKLELQGRRSPPQAESSTPTCSSS